MFGRLCVHIMFFHPLSRARSRANRTQAEPNLARKCNKPETGESIEHRAACTRKHTLRNITKLHYTTRLLRWCLHRAELVDFDFILGLLGFFIHAQVARVTGVCLGLAVRLAPKKKPVWSHRTINTNSYASVHLFFTRCVLRCVIRSCSNKHMHTDRHTNKHLNMARVRWSLRW